MFHIARTGGRRSAELPQLTLGGSPGVPPAPYRARNEGEAAHR